jgi:hypothetical protein
LLPHRWPRRRDLCRHLALAGVAVSRAKALAAVVMSPRCSTPERTPEQVRQSIDYLTE